MRLLKWTIVFGLVLSPSAWAQTVTPITEQQLSSLEWSTVTPKTIESLIQRNVNDAGDLARKALRDFDETAATAPFYVVFGKYNAMIETYGYCKHGTDTSQMMQESNEIGVAHDNVIKLEQILYKKLANQNKLNQYWAFTRTPTMLAFNQLSNPTTKAKASCGKTKPAPKKTAQPAPKTGTKTGCGCVAPTGPYGSAAQEEAAVNGYAQCQVRCNAKGGLPGVPGAGGAGRN
jgi:hypothetical protein